MDDEANFTCSGRPAHWVVCKRNPDTPVRCSVCGSIPRDEAVSLAGGNPKWAAEQEVVTFRYDTGTPEARERVGNTICIVGGIVLLQFRPLLHSKD